MVNVISTSFQKGQIPNEISLIIRFIQLLLLLLLLLRIFIVLLLLLFDIFRIKNQFLQRSNRNVAMNLGECSHYIPRPIGPWESGTGVCSDNFEAGTESARVNERVDASEALDRTGHVLAEDNVTAENVEIHQRREESQHKLRVLSGSFDLQKQQQKKVRIFFLSLFD